MMRPWCDHHLQSYCYSSQRLTRSIDNPCMSFATRSEHHRLRFHARLNIYRGSQAPIRVQKVHWIGDSFFKTRKLKSSSQQRWAWSLPSERSGIRMDEASDHNCTIHWPLFLIDDTAGHCLTWLESDSYLQS